LRARARDLGIAERVVFAGPLDERSTASLYANAAALLFPSRYEGFGLPVHEARAQGCPVVARELPVLDELAGSDVTRLDANVEAWSAALERLAATSNRSGTARVASAPPRAAIPWEDAARKLARLYARLLPADRQDPRADVRRDHGPLLAQVAKALRETDPMALHAMGAPADEYDPEVGTIVPRLASARTLDDVERIVHEEFVHWFGASAGSRERFRTTATRIWETLGALGRRR
jgi:hypothetical protein